MMHSFDILAHSRHRRYVLLFISVSHNLKIFIPFFFIFIFMSLPREFVTTQKKKSVRLQICSKNGEKKRRKKMLKIHL